VVHVPLHHAAIHLVVEHFDGDRIVEERAVANDQHNRARRRREFLPEREADALAEPAQGAEEALRHVHRQVLAHQERCGNA